LKNGNVRVKLGAMNTFHPAIKILAAIVVAASAFGGLFWLLFGRGGH
jgi:hypothetical protein